MRLFIVLLFFFCPAVLGAAERLDLTRALELAKKNNYQLMASEAQVRAAQARAGIARSRFLPQINLHESFSHGDNPVNVFSTKLNQENFKDKDLNIKRLNHPSSINNINSTVEMIQPLFNRGEEITEFRSARLGEEIRLNQLDFTFQEVLFQVEKAFLSWLLAFDHCEVAQKSVETARANLLVVKNRVEEGLTLKSDLLQSQVHLASLEREKLAAENEIAISHSALNFSIGLPLETEWEPVREGAFCKFDSKELAEWISLAMENRSDLSSYRNAVEQSACELKGTKLAFLPALNLKGIYENNSEGIGRGYGDSYTVWALAEFNIFKGFADRKRVSEAKAIFEASSARLKYQEQLVRHEVRTTYLNVHTASKQLKVAEAAVVRAEEGLRIIEKRHQNGLVLIVELLDAQTACKRAAMEHQEALYDYYLSLSELRFRAGLLGKGENSGG